VLGTLAVCARELEIDIATEQEVYLDLTGLYGVDGWWTRSQRTRVTSSTHHFAGEK
jgi:hypothetical protein